MRHSTAYLMLAVVLFGAPTPSPAADPALDAPEPSPDEPLGETGDPPETEEPPVFTAELTGSAWIASFSGYLQTSKGGGAGTTSFRRPTLREIGLGGIRVSPIGDGRLILLGNHELHLNYVGIHIDGNAILQEQLTSQAVTFPAGSAVDSKLDLDMFRVGYRPHWLKIEFAGWSLLPELGFSFDPFQYRLQSPTVAGEVDRSYTIGFPYFEVLLEGPIVGYLRGEIDVAASAGVNGVTFLDLDLRLAYTLLDLSAVRAAIVVGLKGSLLRRRDFQTPQFNDIEVLGGSFSSQPWAGLTAGLRLGF